jgi:hypothetical protein
MADPVAQAKRQLHHAHNEREERTAAFWQQAVNDGRALRQARVEMQASQSQTPQRDERTQEPATLRRQRSR